MMQTTFTPALFLACSVGTWRMVYPLRPNPSLEPTSSGTARKPAVWLLEHLHTSGLRAAPPGSAQLER
jgi:hypothetical protein